MMQNDEGLTEDGAFPDYGAPLEEDEMEERCSASCYSEFEEGRDVCSRHGSRNPAQADGDRDLRLVDDVEEAA